MLAEIFMLRIELGLRRPVTLPTAFEVRFVPIVPAMAGPSAVGARSPSK